jgi:hypothetical protein
MKKRLYFIVVTLICLMCTGLIPKQAEASDSRVTITFAGATVIGGVYVLISWSISDSFKWRHDFSPHSALFNFDSKKWFVGLPELKLVEHNNTHVTPCMDILKFRF